MDIYDVATCFSKSFRKRHTDESVILRITEEGSAVCKGKTVRKIVLWHIGPEGKSKLLVSSCIMDKNDHYEVMKSSQDFDFVEKMFML